MLLFDISFVTNKKCYDDNMSTKTPQYEKEAYIQQWVKLLEQLPLTILKDKPAKSNPVSFVELRHVTKRKEQWLQGESAAEHLCNRIPPGGNRAKKDLFLKVVVKTQLGEFVTNGG
jgi:hypothetical protein